MTTRRDQTEGPDERYEHRLEELTDRRQVRYPGTKEESSWQAANQHVIRFTDELSAVSEKAGRAGAAFDCRHDLGNYSSSERREIVAAMDTSFKKMEFYGDDHARHDLADDISKTIFDPIQKHVEQLEYRLQQADAESPTGYTMADHQTSQAAMKYFQESFAEALEHGDPDSLDATKRMETLLRYSTIHFNEANIQWANHDERTNDAAREVVEIFQQHLEFLQGQMKHPSYRNPFPPGGEEQFKDLLQRYDDQIEKTETLIDKRTMDHTQKIAPEIDALIEKSAQIDQAITATVTRA